MGLPENAHKALTMKNGPHYIERDAFQRMLDQWPECSFIGCIGDCFIQLLSADKHKLGSIYLKYQDDNG